MDTANQDQGLPTDDQHTNLETRRAIIRQSLNEIASDVGIGMRDAGLTFPFGLTVPESGQSLITMVTPVDPSDDDWSQATTIVCQIVTQKLGGFGVRCRPLTCITVNPSMIAAEIVPNTLVFDTRA